MLVKRKEAINLLRGWPNPSLHPKKQLLEASSVVLNTPDIATPSLQYGPDEGYGPLRTEIAKWLADFYSAPADDSRICITGGASQNLACALQVFSDVQYTKAVWMVAPCYFLGCRIFEDNGFAGRLRAVREDAQGVDLDYLERGLQNMDSEVKDMPPLKPVRTWGKFYRHIIYAVPSFSNPSGITLPFERRKRLVELARKHDALIITDDVYDFLQWSTTTEIAMNAPPTAIVPRLSDIDRSLPPLASDPKHFGHTMSNGSFSKLSGPGMRTGWTDSMPALSYALSQCGSSRSGGCPSQFSAAIMTQLLKSGQLQQHIEVTLRPAYQRRWMLVMEQIERLLVPLGVEVVRDSLAGANVAGGYFIWIRLSESYEAEQVAELAWNMEELVLGRGSLFEVYGDENAARFSRELRLCFSWVSEAELVEGIERLARTLVGIREGSYAGGKPQLSEKKGLGEFK